MKYKIKQQLKYHTFNFQKICQHNSSSVWSPLQSIYSEHWATGF